MTAIENMTTETLEAIADAFNRHDVDGVMAFFAEDAVFESPKGPDPWGRRFVGKAQVREGIAARFAGIPDVHYGDGSHWVSGDRGVSEWTLTGNHDRWRASPTSRLRPVDISRRASRQEGLVLEDRGRVKARLVTTVPHNS